MPDTRARQRMGLPRVFDPQVVCPGGEPIAEAPAGSGCRCRIEHSSVLSAENPTSLLGFCCSRYRTCPTWISEKERIEAGRREALVKA